MSFVPQPPLDNELAQAREQEPEWEEEEYARKHPDGSPPKRHAIRRLWDLLSRRHNRGDWGETVGLIAPHPISASV
jgi:hypothetical protein